MKTLTGIIVLLLAATSASAQVAPVANPDHQAMLASDDPQLAANKRLVYDWWREIFEAHHVDLADRYMGDTWIEHNPNIPSGREAFLANLSKRERLPIQDRVQRPLIAIVAEKDIVSFLFVREFDDPNRPGQTYRTTWLDAFRVADGKVVEHWDSALLRAQ